jgi:tetratricopeptide (TPR) repeat protein
MDDASKSNSDSKNKSSIRRKRGRQSSNSVVTPTETIPAKRSRGGLPIHEGTMGLSLSNNDKEGIRDQKKGGASCETGMKSSSSPSLSSFSTAAAKSTAPDHRQRKANEQTVSIASNLSQKMFGTEADGLWKKKERNRFGKTFGKTLAPNVMALLSAANKFFFDGKYGEALAHFTKVVDMVPRHPDAYAMMGSIYEDNTAGYHDLERALECYLNSARLTSGGLGHYHKVLDIAHEIGDIDHCHFALKYLIKFDHDPVIYTKKIHLHLQAGDIGKAMETLDRMLAKFPNEVDYFSTFGEGCVEANEPNIGILWLIRYILHYIGTDGIRNELLEAIEWTGVTAKPKINEDMNSLQRAICTTVEWLLVHSDAQLHSFKNGRRTKGAIFSGPLAAWELIKGSFEYLELLLDHFREKKESSTQEKSLPAVSREVAILFAIGSLGSGGTPGDALTGNKILTRQLQGLSAEDAEFREAIERYDENLVHTEKRNDPVEASQKLDSKLLSLSSFELQELEKDTRSATFASLRIRVLAAKQLASVGQKSAAMKWVANVRGHYAMDSEIICRWRERPLASLSMEGGKDVIVVSLKLEERAKMMKRLAKVTETCIDMDNLKEDQILLVEYAVGLFSECLSFNPNDVYSLIRCTMLVRLHFPDHMKDGTEMLLRHVVELVSAICGGSTRMRSAEMNSCGIHGTTNFSGMKVTGKGTRVLTHEHATCEHVDETEDPGTRICKPDYSDNDDICDGDEIHAAAAADDDDDDDDDDADGGGGGGGNNHIDEYSESGEFLSSKLSVLAEVQEKSPHVGVSGRQQGSIFDDNEAKEAAKPFEHYSYGPSEIADQVRVFVEYSIHLQQINDKMSFLCIVLPILEAWLGLEPPNPRSQMILFGSNELDIHQLRVAFLNLRPLNKEALDNTQNSCWAVARTFCSFVVIDEVVDDAKVLIPLLKHAIEVLDSTEIMPDVLAALLRVGGKHLSYEGDFMDKFRHLLEMDTAEDIPEVTASSNKESAVPKDAIIDTRYDFKCEGVRQSAHSLHHPTSHRVRGPRRSRGNPRSRLETALQILLNDMKAASPYAREICLELVKYPYSIPLANRLTHALSLTPEYTSLYSNAPENRIKVIMKLHKTYPTSIPFALLCAHYHCTKRKYNDSLCVYMDAFSLDPKQPLTVLCIATQLLFLSRSALVNNRHETFLKGFAMMEWYGHQRLVDFEDCTVNDDNKACVTEKMLTKEALQQEVFYNLGRCMEEVELNNLAVDMYQRVLKIADGCIHELESANLTSEAAHNLVGIYRRSNNVDQALQIMRKYLVF